MEGAKRKVFWIGMTLVVAAAPFLGMEAYTIQIFTLAGIYATVALGLNLVLGNAGQISLGQAAFFGIGAYVTAQLMLKAGLSFVIALAAGGCLAGVAGISLGYLALRFHGHYLAMVTLCFGLIMQTFFLQVPDLTGGAAGVTDIPSPQLFGSAVDNSPGSWCKTFHLAWFLFMGMAWFLSNLLSLQRGRTLAALRDTPMSILEIEGLSKQFGGILALFDVSFEVETGSIFGVIGPNGAGKTTLFNCVSGLESPTQGRIRFKGAGIEGLPPTGSSGRESHEHSRP